MSFAYNPTAGSSSSSSGVTPKFLRLRKTADQTFTGAAEKCTWDVEDVDEANGCNLASSNTKIFTAPTAGILELTFRVRWTALTTSGDFRWMIFKRFNSSDVVQERWDMNRAWRDDIGQASNQCEPVQIKMAAGDYVELQGFNGTIDDVGGTLSTGAFGAMVVGVWWAS